MTSQIHRRGILAGVAGSALAPQLAVAADLDLNDSAQSLLAFAKLTGNSAGGAVLRWHTGVINAVQPGQKPTPLVGYEGLEKEVWGVEADGAYSTAYFDIGFFTDLATGERLKMWSNPLTNETVETMAFHSGRFASTLKADGPKRVWQRRGDDVWTVSSPNVGFPSLLKPEVYPAESSGPFQFFSVVRTDRGRMSDLANQKLTSAPLTWTYTLTTVWLPWMRMGQRPGAVVWSGNGGKYHSAADVPEKFKVFLAEEQPDYLTNGQPWSGVRTMWADYMASHPPRTPT